jgi:hypothetical protein
LWTGNRDKGGINLVKWENIAKPKKYGGWGFKNILLFGKALAAKSLWRSLTVPSLWKEVVKDKYLKKKEVADWLRSESRGPSQKSNCWSGLVYALNVVKDWVSWKPGKWRTY